MDTRENINLGRIKEDILNIWTYISREKRRKDSKKIKNKERWMKGVDENKE